MPGKPKKSAESPLPTQEPDASDPSTQRAEAERGRQLHGLAVLSLFLHCTATVQEMMMALLEKAPTVTGAVLVYPLVMDRKRHALCASVLDGCTDARLDSAMDAFQEDLTALEFSLVKNQTLERFLSEGEVVLQDGLSALMEGVLPQEQTQAAMNELGIKKVAFVPMVVEGEPLGMLVFAFDRDEVDIEVLELLAGHLTLALRDMTVRDEVGRFSDVDPVTWVYSRRYLLQALRSEMERAGRYGRGLALVLVDIDDFGPFNESYGQSLGDRLLRAVATTLAETVSPPELVARIKDDDFAVLLPETNRASAVTAVTRLLASIAHVSVFGDGEESSQPVTASVTIACFPEDADTPQALLAHAQADLDDVKRERASEQNGSPDADKGETLDRASGE